MDAHSPMQMTPDAEVNQGSLHLEFDTVPQRSRSKEVFDVLLLLSTYFAQGYEADEGASRSHAVENESNRRQRSVKRVFRELAATKERSTPAFAAVLLWLT